MKIIKHSLLASALIIASGNVFADECNNDATSPIIPDGNVASKDELIAAQGSIKSYQEQMLDYRDCLLAKEQALDPEAEDFEAMKAALVALSDASVEKEELVAAEFNNAVKAFKAR